MSIHRKSLLRLTGFRLRNFLAAILLALVVCGSPAHSQEVAAAGADATADELRSAGYTAYGAGKFAESITAFTRYLNEYGKSAEAAKDLPQILPYIALSNIRLEKWSEASEAIENFLANHAAKAAASAIEEMTFWGGVCDFQQQNSPEARQKLEDFVQKFPNSVKRAEARMFVGMTYVQEENFAKVASYFAEAKNQLAPSMRDRATLLELYGKVESDQTDDALRLVVGQYPRLQSMTQMAGFELLTLQLGSEFLAKGEYRKAVAAFQRVWDRERILKHQQTLLGGLQEQLTIAGQRHLDAATIFQIQQNIRKVEKDLESMGKVENFDSALRLRLASCYLGMKRYREAAVIMDQMLAEMPPDPMVEKATVNLVQCWEQVERWPKAIEVADAFVEKFPKSKDLGQVLFFKGQALMSDQRNPEAIVVFDDVVKRFPADAIVGRALFMKGYAQLLNDQNAAGIITLESIAKKYPQDPLADSAAYWVGMGYSFDKQHDKAREVLAAYLQKYRAGQHVDEARFRMAYEAQSLKKYDVSTKELRSYLQDFPKGTGRNDALVLLGDALMAQGKIREGMEAFAEISPDEPRFFEEGWFKTAKALRLQEKPEEMRSHLEKFITDYPKSFRVAEATYWIGWSWKQNGDLDQARAIYWKGIRELGNEPAAIAVEDLLSGVGKLYPDDTARAQLLTEFRDLAASARAGKKNVLVLRCLWAESRLLQKKDPTAIDALLAQAAALADVKVVNPALLADFADALRRSGNVVGAEKMYRDLLKWNPRAVQKDRAFAGLGQIALGAGQEKEALDYFGRFEKETIGSPLFGEILLAKAGLESKRGQTEAAQATLEKILANKFVRGKDKAEALCRTGDLMLDKGKADLAVPYYQRIYVMYGRWSGIVARAYLRSGEAFEKLKDRESAIKTYQEMGERPELAEFAETREAKERLAKLEAGA